MFTSFLMFCSCITLQDIISPPLEPQDAETVSDGYKEPCRSVRTQNRDGPRLFTNVAWFHLDLGAHVRCGFSDGPNKFEINQATSFRLCLSLWWWIVMIFQDLSREYYIGTGTQSAHIQMGFQRENFSFALNGSSWTISRPNLTLGYATFYTCGARANEPCQTIASSLWPR